MAHNESFSHLTSLTAMIVAHVQNKHMIIPGHNQVTIIENCMSHTIENKGFSLTNLGTSCKWASSADCSVTAGHQGPHQDGTGLPKIYTPPSFLQKLLAGVHCMHQGRLVFHFLFLHCCSMVVQVVQLLQSTTVKLCELMVNSHVWVLMHCNKGTASGCTWKGLSSCNLFQCLCYDHFINHWSCFQGFGLLKTFFWLDSS